MEITINGIERTITLDGDISVSKLKLMVPDFETYTLILKEKIDHSDYVRISYPWINEDLKGSGGGTKGIVHEIEKYTYHIGDCQSLGGWSGQRPECSCGLHAALKKFKI